MKYYELSATGPSFLGFPYPWRAVSPMSGHGGYARAIHAPWYVQDAVAYDVAITRGQRFHWNGTGC
jgi:hypothetical protein